MAITFTNLVGDWRRIVEDYVTDPGNAADAPGVEGTITVTPLLGEGRHAPKGVPSGGVFYTFAPLDLRVYRGLLMDENMNSDITLAIEVDEYPVAWRARFDLQYRRIKIPLQDVIFGPNEIVGGQISLSSLVTRDGLPPEYEGSYVQLMDAVRAAADHADRAEQAANNVDAAVAGAADVVVAAVEADRVAAEAAATAAAADRVQTGLDRAATSADRVQTGLDRSAASGAASAAAGSESAALSSAEDAELWATSFGLTASATTGQPGTNASVAVTGTGPDYGLSLTVPRGDKGEQGEQGVQGAKGDTGGTGLKGDKGDTGDRGLQGERGLQGIQGEQGPRGLQGEKGDKGDTGPKGDRGDDGEVSQAALDAAVATLVDNAPEALNTLSELATSLGNDPNFATTVSTEIGLRAKTTDVDAALAGKSDVEHTHPVTDLTATGTRSASTYLRGDGSWAGVPSVYIDAKQFGVAADGTTDDTAALQSAVDAASAGGVVVLPAGTMRAAGITISTGVHLRGQGAGVTTIKAPDNASSAVLRTDNFASLTGQSSPSVSAIPRRFGVSHLTVDGNRGNGGAGRGLELYGFEWTLSYLEVLECGSDGIYTELDASVDPPGRFQESFAFAIRTHHNAGHGWWENGVHDSVFTAIISHNNGVNSANVLAEGKSNNWTDCHTWGYTKYGFHIRGREYLTNVQCEGATEACMFVEWHEARISGGAVFWLEGPTAVGLKIANSYQAPSNIIINGLYVYDVSGDTGPGIDIQQVGEGLNLRALVKVESGGTAVVGTPPKDAVVDVQVSGGPGSRWDHPAKPVWIGTASSLPATGTSGVLYVTTE